MNLAEGNVVAFADCIKNVSSQQAWVLKSAFRVGACICFACGQCCGVPASRLNVLSQRAWIFKSAFRIGACIRLARGQCCGIFALLPERAQRVQADP